MPTTPFLPEHAALRDSVRRLVDTELADTAAQAEGGADVHEAAVLRCAQQGLLELGDLLADVVVAEELGRLRSGGLVAVLLDAMLTTQTGLDPAEGITAVARDASVSVTAERAEGDVGFLIGGAVATRCLLPDDGWLVHAGDGWAAVPLERPHALRGGAVAEVTLRAAHATPCRLAADAWDLALLREAAAAVAGAWVTWRTTHEYAQQREAFGRPVGSFQVNRHTLAETATWLTAAEALVHDAAFGAAHDDRGLITTARRYAGRVSVQVADVAVQLHGGYGYTSDFDAQRAWRDARALTLGIPDDVQEGTR